MNDNRMEQAMGRLLQAGVLIAALAMAIGGIRYLASHGGQVSDYRVFRPVLPMSGNRALWAGVLVMLATPVMRVAFALFAFAAERDWLYTGVSAAVLGLLAWSILA